MQQRHSADEEEGAPRIPEKEFLLVQAQSIHTNPNSLILPGEDIIDPLITEWIANGHLITQVGHHRPRLRIEFQRWANITRPLGPNGPQPDAASAQGWSTLCPQYVGGGGDE